MNDTPSTSTESSDSVAATATATATATAAATATSTAADPSGRPPLPDRLSTDARSPFHDRPVFDHDIGIRLNGNDRTDVAEYCVSEGWVKVPVGNKVDRKGQPLLIKLKGVVEAFYR